MKSRLFAYLLCGAIVTAFDLCANAIPPQAEDPVLNDKLYDTATEDRLEKIKVKVNWQGSTEGALADLAKKCEEADPGKPAIKFSIDLKGGNPANLKRIHSEVHVLLADSNVAANEAIQYFCQQTNLRQLIHHNSVIFVP